MIYHSTRNTALQTNSARAVLEGLAPDGGLYVPQALPRIDVQKVLAQDAMGMAKMLLKAMLPDIQNMDTLVERAYRGKFTAADLTPTVSAGPFTVLELFHGPTSAFKDVALCMLPQLLTQAKKQEQLQEDILILTATSGDTGKAALEGFKDVDGVKICVFYPHGGVSKVQQAQMVTQEGSNVAVCAVRGNFDDAQTGVKNLFAMANDGRLPGSSARVSTANSINIGRLAPQITYYFKAYKDLLASGRICFGDKVNFCVPTGNFGDILAGFLAKRLGLPVGKLLCASNANNVLTDFINTGVYDRRRHLHKTVSPSMDILVSSNLERLLYLLSEDTRLVAKLMKELNEQGHYTVPEKLLQDIQSQFYAGCCDDEGTKKAIGRAWETGYLCDTHTATAWAVAEEYVAQTADAAPMVVLSTASPYKFPAAVLSALEESELTDEFMQMERLQALTGVAIPKNLTGLQEKKRLHNAVIGKDEMLQFVQNLER